MFDAYTIKKVLPKLVIAIILIQLSWFIFSGMIFITESVAFGIEGLIYAPFGSPDDFTFEALFTSIGGSDIQTVFYTLVTVGAAVAAFGGSIVAFALIAILALFIGVLTLVIRRIMLILLLVLAPIALVAWILPNTERFWKMWWDNFSKLLLMYPIILAMIAAGRVFAKIGGDYGEESIAVIMVLGGVFLPLALIPKTFSMAGAGFAALGGALANRGMNYGKGFAASGRKRGGKRWMERGQRAKSGNFFKKGNEDNWRGRVNRGLAGAANIKQAGLDPRRMRSNMRTALNDSTDAAVGEYTDKSAAFSAIKGDDEKLWAAKFTDHDQIANELASRDASRFGGEANRARREEAVASIMRAQKETSHGTFQRARLAAQAKTGTGYQDADGNFNAGLMLDDINSTYGSDRNGAGRAVAGMRGDLAQSGQIAGQAGFSTWAGQLENRYNNKSTQLESHNAIMDDTIDSVSPGNAMFGKPSSAAAVGEAHARRLGAIADSIGSGAKVIATGEDDAEGNAIMRAATEDDLDASLAASAGLLDAMGQAAPQNASAFANQLMNVELPVGAVSNDLGTNGQILGQSRANVSVRDLIETRMNNDQFRSRRRDLMSQARNTGTAPDADTAAAAQRQAGQVQPPTAGGGVTGMGGGIQGL